MRAIESVVTAINWRAKKVGEQILDRPLLFFIGSLNDSRTKLV